MKQPSGEKTSTESRRDPWQLPMTTAYGVLAILIRLIPFSLRPPNFAAHGALGLFGGAKTPLYFIIPVQWATLAVSDTILYYAYRWEPFNLAVYVGFTVYALLGRAFLRKRDSVMRITGVTWLGSLVFFLLTNFAAWIQLSPLGSGPVLYEASLAGLLHCYAQGFVFFLFTLAGDFGCTAMMFGVEAWLRAKNEQRQADAAATEVRV